MTKEPTPPKSEPSRPHPSTAASGDDSLSITPKTSRTNSDEWAAIGEVSGVFGIHGALKVHPLTDFPERFKAGLQVFVGDRESADLVVEARVQPRQIILSLERVTSIEEAERLRGARLYIAASDVVPLAPDQFYIHDIIGAHAEKPDGEPLGTIRDVITSAGQDLFVVTPTSGGDDVLVPVVHEFVKSIDIPGKRVVIAPIPGLFDENADEVR